MPKAIKDATYTLWFNIQDDCDLSSLPIWVSLMLSDDTPGSFTGRSATRCPGWLPASFPAFRYPVVEIVVERRAKCPFSVGVLALSVYEVVELALRANIDETVLLVVITEQGEKRNHP